MTENANPDNKLFDNGGGDHIAPPHSAEELWALKKERDRKRARNKL